MYIFIAPLINIHNIKIFHVCTQTRRGATLFADVIFPPSSTGISFSAGLLKILQRPARVTFHWLDCLPDFSDKDVLKDDRLSKRLLYSSSLRNKRSSPREIHARRLRAPRGPLREFGLFPMHVYGIPITRILPPETRQCIGILGKILLF